MSAHSVNKYAKQIEKFEAKKKIRVDVISVALSYGASKSWVYIRAKTMLFVIL
jgi:hypothetical protein